MLSNLPNGAPNPPVANTSHPNQDKPYLVIVEQPASKALRFRYECEGRSAGSIPGVNSTPENKTFPSIKIVGFKGDAVVVVSCVTKDEPHRAHPHNLVGRDCKDGIHTFQIKDENMTVVFPNLGIQCVKKKDIEEALNLREHKRVDPFNHGFDHKTQPSAIDLNAVRLCFQAFLFNPEKKKYTKVVPPVVSDPIYDKKAMSDLVITKLSHSSAPAKGGQEMILLCEKVAKEDIQVHFFEEQNGLTVWEGYGEFTAGQVHKQVAICFKTPQYSRQIEAGRKAKVYIQLKRQSDGAVSEPLPFHFIPEDASGKKRKLTNEESRADELMRLYPPRCSISPQRVLDYGIVKTESHSPSYEPNYLNSPPGSSQASPCPNQQVPSPYQQVPSPYQQVPSPYQQVQSPNPLPNLFQSALPSVQTENQPLPSFNHLSPPNIGRRTGCDFRTPLAPSDPSANMIGVGAMYTNVTDVPDNQARNRSPSNTMMMTGSAGNGGGSAFVYSVGNNSVQATNGAYYLDLNEIHHHVRTGNPQNALIMAPPYTFVNGNGNAQTNANGMIFINQAPASNVCQLGKSDPGTSLDNIDKADLVQEKDEIILSENLTSMSITDHNAESLTRIVNEVADNL